MQVHLAQLPAAPFAWLAEPDGVRRILSRLSLLKSSPADSASLATVSGASVVAGGVATVAVRGLMLREAPSWARDCGFATSTMDAAREIAAYVMDPSVQRIAIRWDTPGGDASGCEEFSQALYVANQKKLITSFVESICCSAGIYCAAQTDSIVASPSAVIGSIGAYSVIEDLSRLYSEHLGIDVTVIRSGPAKGMVEGAPVTPEQIRNREEYVQRLHAQFVAAIVRGRGMNESRVKAVATGEWWVAEDALSKGLIDSVGMRENDSRRAPKVSAARMSQRKPASGRMAKEGSQVKYSQILALLMADATPLTEGSSETVGAHVTAALGTSSLTMDERVAPGFPETPEDKQPAASELDPKVAARLAALEQRAAKAEREAQASRAKEESERYSAEAAGYTVIGRTAAQLAEDLRKADKAGIGESVRASFKASTEAAKNHPALKTHGTPSAGLAAVSTPDTQQGARAKLDELTRARMAEQKEEYHVAYKHVARENPAILAVAR